MLKLDDSSGALSAVVVAKETLKDRVTQLHGIDYDKTFSPVGKPVTI